MAELSLFDKYRLEIEEDTKIDDFNLKEKQMELPTIKHKWVARLIQQRKEKKKLVKAKKVAISKVKDRLGEESIVTLSNRALLQQAEYSEIVQKINGLIADSEDIILYLEKVEKLLSQTTFDIKNVIDIRKLELT